MNVPRPRFRDLAIGSLPKTRFDVVEPKIDGMWVTVEIDAGRAILTAQTGEVRETWAVAAEVSATLLGELVVGTQRGAKSTQAGRVVVFDCVRSGRWSVMRRALRERRQLAAAVVRQLEDDRIELVEQHPIAAAPTLWTEVRAGRLEGVVVKASGSPWGAEWGRCKPIADADYVCTGFATRAGGAVTSVVGSLFRGDRLVPVCKAGHLTGAQAAEFAKHPECYVGLVFRATGRERLESGALRHPAFDRWRPDKLATECRG